MKKTHAIINKISEKAYHMHLYLSHIIKADLWDRIDSTIGMKCENNKERPMEKQRKKFTARNKSQKTRNSPNAKVNIVNLSSLQLDEAIVSVLDRGLNFTIASR